MWNQNVINILVGKIYKFYKFSNIYYTCYIYMCVCVYTCICIQKLFCYASYRLEKEQQQQTKDGEIGKPKRNEYEIEKMKQTR